MRGALVILLLAGPAFADNGPHTEGQYGGVTPGETQPRAASAPTAKAKRPPPRGTLTWVGFEAKSGGAEVFFQSVAPFELTQQVEGASLVVRLGLSRLGHNTWRQINTRFFDNPLSGIVARAVGAARATKGRPAHGPGIEARITFKNASDARQATVRTATEADGLYYAYLSFPMGTAPAASPSSATPPPSEPAAPESGEVGESRDSDDAPPPSHP
jgi:hypothetical protein